VVLVDRVVERDRIGLLLEDARLGRSGVLVVRGEPGIGKSVLCADAVSGALGMRVLGARGFEAESELPFACLADLFRPVLGCLGAIPGPQAAALEGALALGPPVGGDRFTVCAATLSLLAAAAEAEGPLLVVVDEAQWLDRSSAEALLFAARRLDAEGVAVLVAARSGESTVFDRADFPELLLGGLPVDAAAELVGSAEGPAIAPAVLERLLVATGGNPLALLELPALLTAGQRGGSEPLDPLLPTSDALEYAFLSRVRQLPEASQLALLVAAASATAEAGLIDRALVEAGVAPGALDAAERAGLVSLADGLLEFRHPLLRSAVYRDAPAGARRSAHQALAEASAREPERAQRAWHLAAAAPAPDAGIAAQLEETGLVARRRGGHPEAASALERAARLSTSGEERARLLREAADSARLAGQAERALVLLEEALAATSDPLLHAEIQHLRATIEMWAGAPLSAYEHLTAEAAQIEALDPARAAWMLTDAGWACFMAGEISIGRAAAERAFALAEDAGGLAEIVACALLGIALLLSGERERAGPFLRRYQPLLEQADFLERTYTVIWPAGQALIWLEEYQKAHDVFTRLIDTARAKSTPSLLPYALAGLAELEFRTGAWPTAYANGCEAVRLAEETGQPAALAFALSGLARIEAAQGRQQECREHAARVVGLATGGASAALSYAASALALLELGLGRNEEAIGQLEQVSRRTREHGLAEPSVIQWAPDLIEAYTRSGRTQDAQQALTRFDGEARTSGGSWALAAAARCRGLLANPDSFEQEFSQALRLHQQTPTPFEKARTELCLGERQRRTGRRAESRTHLRAALDSFEQLGATPWADRARNELQASGETLQQSDPDSQQQLTPQELQIAHHVARGGTNREVGAALFLSPKTIETHLGHIYRKLNLRSRTQLAALIASEGALTPI
jgi:DNA-binding CsgD family transcriptional regulator